MKPLKTFLALAALLLVATTFALATGMPLVLGAVGIGLAIHGGMRMVPHTQGSMTILADILWDDGADNMGGLRTEAYYCFHSEVLTHTAPVARSAATTLNQLSIATADHTFREGKGWKKIYTTEDTGMVESTVQGEKDGKSFMNKIKLHFPGSGARINGLIRYGVNAGWYAIGADAEGLKRLVGTQYWPAKLDTATLTTTETAAGRKGVTFELVCSSPYPAPIVAASLQIESDASES
jgi:hypothetical protein